MHSSKTAFAAMLVISAGSVSPALASTLFAEDFSGSSPGTYGVGAIPGTNVSVTAANVDIVGVLNGSFFSCTDQSDRQLPGSGG